MRTQLDTDEAIGRDRTFGTDGIGYHSQTRSVIYTINMPDGVSPEELEAASLNTGCGGIIVDQAEVRYTVRPCPGDDDDPADVRLRDLWPPEG